MAQITYKLEIFEWLLGQQFIDRIYYLRINFQTLVYNSLYYELAPLFYTDDGNSHLISFQNEISQEKVYQNL